MKVLKIIIVLLILIMSVGAVCAAENSTEDDISTEILQNSQNEVYTTIEASFTNLTGEIEDGGTFTNLASEIDKSEGTIDLQHDYTFNNESDTGYVVIKKNNFIINGNNYILDGNQQSGIFNITGDNITINDLVFVNGMTDMGGIIDSTGTLTLNNVTFISNNVTFISDHLKYSGGAIKNKGGMINCYNSRFIDNYAQSGSAIFIENGTLNLKNTNITSTVSNTYGQIWARYSTVNIENVNFINISATYSPALALEICNQTNITNSKFINLTAKISAGAISLKEKGELHIKNCEFINTTSLKNAGAINIDYIIDSEEYEPYSVDINDCIFYNASSMIGGAYIQLGGQLFLNNTSFINNKATYYGGALYISYTNSTINNCIFSSNSVELLDDYPTLGGALYCDYSNLTTLNSKFINNCADDGAAIYACDSKYNITGSTFENNINAIYTDFDLNYCILDDNTYNNDSIITNQTFQYPTYVDSPASELKLINNTINITSLPSKFDLRDWGWTSPVKDQGNMGSCWTFAAISAVESTILKAYGVKFNLSESNMQHNMLKYSHYGCDEEEGGDFFTAASYLLCWLGPVLEEEDIYDEVGKLSPFQVGDDVIHIQDVILVLNDEIPNATKIKSAILNYGELSTNYYAADEDEEYYDSNKSTQYTNESLESNHEVSIIGWDDNFPKEKFLITPPGDGAWIIKNSWGDKFGDNGILYISYYDETFAVPPDFINQTRTIILTNTVPYNKNYQHDFVWNGEFISINELKDTNGNITYSNQFESADNDLIAGVGTYFNSSDVNYTVKIYVNNQLKLTQEGISPFSGFHTIKLNEYIPIKKGDIFKATVTSNLMPYINKTQSRAHHVENESFLYYDDEWIDLYGNWNITPCLKVYTVDLPIYTEDLVKIYKNDSKFEANIGVANETVTFEINGRNYTRISDENGTASMAINLGPGNYTIKTMFNGTSVENTITVLPTLLAENLVKYYKNASQFYISLIDGECNPVMGVNITMNINGVFYNRTTNENGTARLNINLIPGEYILTAIDPLTGLQMPYNITVLPTLNATDLEMTYQDGSTFNVTVRDGQGNPAKKATVTFNINGVLYNRATDSHGIARLNINLMAGKYIITSEYDGFKIANTITIKDKI